MFWIHAKKTAKTILFSEQTHVTVNITHVKTHTKYEAKKQDWISCFSFSALSFSCVRFRTRKNFWKAKCRMGERRKREKHFNQMARIIVYKSTTTASGKNTHFFMVNVYETYKAQIERKYHSYNNNSTYALVYFLAFSPGFSYWRDIPMYTHATHICLIFLSSFFFLASFAVSFALFHSLPHMYVKRTQAHISGTCAGVFRVNWQNVFLFLPFFSSAAYTKSLFPHWILCENAIHKITSAVVWMRKKEEDIFASQWIVVPFFCSFLWCKQFFLVLLSFSQ